MKNLEEFIKAASYIFAGSMWAYGIFCFGFGSVTNGLLALILCELITMNLKTK